MNALMPDRPKSEPKSGAKSKTRPIGAGTKNVSFNAHDDFADELQKLVDAGDVSKAEYIRTFLQPAIDKQIVIKKQTQHISLDSQDRTFIEPDSGDSQKPGKS